MQRSAWPCLAKSAYPFESFGRTILGIRTLTDRPRSTRIGQRCYQIYRDAVSLLSSSKLTPSVQSRPVEVIGHVRSIRLQKRRAFINLGDGSTTQTIQALLSPEQAVGVSTGAAVRIRGSWQPCPPSKQQTHELMVGDIEILGPSDAEIFPIQKQQLSPEFLRTLPHLRIRTSSNALLARLRSECEFLASSYFRNGGFIRLHPPAITSSDCEGAGEVFIVSPNDKGQYSQREEREKEAGEGNTRTATEFFKTPKYLTVSSQLHLEAFVHEHQRVWSLAPTFRAEKSDTPRHLSEFYMLEGELRTESLDEVMDVVEDLVRFITKGVQESIVGKELLSQSQRMAGEDVAHREELLTYRWAGLRRPYWPRITYARAITLLEKVAQENPEIFKFPPSWENGLQLEHERYIASVAGNGSPVFVTNYPQHVKPFYMLPTLLGSEANGSRLVKSTQTGVPWESHDLAPRLSAEEQLEERNPSVACFDLLLPDLGELVGGSLREHRHEALSKRMSEHGLAGLSWYLELRKYGSVPHGGFGLGFDRLLMYLSGVDSIRDVVQWPRYYGRCDA